MSPTRSNKDYLLAATKGNGSTSMDVNYPRISLTPGPPPQKGQVGSGGSNPPSSAPSKITVNNAAQQHFQQPSTQAPTSALKPPTVGKTITFTPPQVNQAANPTSSVSRVNRGARRGPVIATLGPSQGDEVIDYGSSEGQKTYKRATSALKDEYDGSADGITVFRMQLSQKAENEGWATGGTGDCVHVPIDGVDHANGVANIIQARTQVDESSLKLWATRELVQQSISPLHINRRAQNNKNMVETITNSLSKDCLTKVGLKQDRYMINGVVIAALLYKIVMEGAELETMVTSANIQQGLQESTKQLSLLNEDVGEYVDFVRESLQKLYARGETTNDQDLVISLFRAFTNSTDADFSTHFKKEELLWMSGMKTYSIESLLSDAEIMYKVKSDNGVWGKKTKEEEELIAMKAEFKDMNLKFSEERKKNKKLRRDATTSSSGGSRRNGPRIREGEEWKLQNPDNKKKMSKEGKTWYWCLNHNNGNGMWTIHKPADCRRAQRPSSSASGSSDNSGSGNNQAMPAVQEEESESESDSDASADY